MRPLVNWRESVDSELKDTWQGWLRDDSLAVGGRTRGSAPTAATRLFLCGRTRGSAPTAATRLFLCGRTRGSAPTATARLFLCGWTRGSAHTAATRLFLCGRTRGSAPTATAAWSSAGWTRGSFVPTNSTKWGVSYLIYPCTTTVTASKDTNARINPPVASTIVFDRLESG